MDAPDRTAPETELGPQAGEQRTGAQEQLPRVKDGGADDEEETEGEGRVRWYGKTRSAG